MSCNQLYKNTEVFRKTGVWQGGGGGLKKEYEQLNINKLVDVQYEVTETWLNKDCDINSQYFEVIRDHFVMTFKTLYFTLSLILLYGYHMISKYFTPVLQTNSESIQKLLN